MPPINWIKGWSGRRSFTALPAAVDVRPCQWVAKVRILFCWEFWDIQSNIRACCRNLTHSLKDSNFRPAVVLPFFGLTWILNVVDGYKMSRTSVAMLIDWCPRMSHALRYSNPAYVERSRRFDDFGASFSWRYGWAGIQFLFSSEIYEIMLTYLNQENSVVTRPSSHLIPVIDYFPLTFDPPTPI